MQKNGTIHSQVQLYSERGFSVIPIKTQGKSPILPSWKEYQSRRPSTEEINSWFSNGNEHNIGIITGKVSGIIVVDFDSKEAYEKAKDRGLSDTPTVKTNRGYHCYFKYKESPSSLATRSGEYRTEYLYAP
jgi:hypothetical protein